MRIKQNDKDKLKTGEIVTAIIDCIQPFINEPMDAVNAYIACAFCTDKMKKELEELRQDAIKIAKERGLDV